MGFRVSCLGFRPCEIVSDVAAAGLELWAKYKDTDRERRLYQDNDTPAGPFQYTCRPAAAGLQVWAPFGEMPRGAGW